MNPDPPDTEQDEAIVALVQKGEREAFRTLVARYEPKMTRYAKRFLFGGDDAKDLVQEVFIKAYVNIQSFDATRRFSPWLYRIAHNECMNALRKRKRDKENVSLFDFDIFLPHLVAKETADGELQHEELKRALDGSMGKLSPKYREPLILYYFEDMDYKAIADILHIPVSTVGVRLQRGKMMLKKLL